MPSRHGILTESPPSGPPLPQDLPRTSDQLVSHLRRHKQKQKKKSCKVRPKSPSLNVALLQQQPPATTAVRPAGRPTVTVPEFTGAFPAVWTAIFIAMFSTPTLATPGSPFVLAWAQKHFVWLFLIYLSVFFPLLLF